MSLISVTEDNGISLVFFGNFVFSLCSGKCDQLKTAFCSGHHD